jgi:3-phenylpropionate/cinnamic acid dioxygenase small subunit
MDTADYVAIQNLLHRYCDLLDRGDLDGMDELFAHATVRLPAVDEPFHNDANDLADNYRKYVRIYDDGTPRTRHMCTNIILEADGPDGARVQSYIMVFQAADKFPLQPLVAARYQDRFERAIHHQLKNRSNLVKNRSKRPLSSLPMGESL